MVVGTPLARSWRMTTARSFFSLLIAVTGCVAPAAGLDSNAKNSDIEVPNEAETTGEPIVGPRQLTSACEAGVLSAAGSPCAGTYSLESVSGTATIRSGPFTRIELGTPGAVGFPAHAALDGDYCFTDAVDYAFRWSCGEGEFQEFRDPTCANAKWIEAQFDESGTNIVWTCHNTMPECGGTRTELNANINIAATDETQKLFHITVTNEAGESLLVSDTNAVTPRDGAYRSSFRVIRVTEAALPERLCVHVEEEADGNVTPIVSGCGTIAELERFPRRTEFATDADTLQLNLLPLRFRTTFCE